MIDPRKKEDFADIFELEAAIQDGLGCCYNELSKQKQGNEKQQNFEAALHHFGAAISGDEKNSEYLKNRASCYFDNNDYEACNDDLSTAMSVNGPSLDAQVLYIQGMAYFVQK